MTDQIRKELAIRTLEKRHEKERGSLVSFIKLYFKNEKPESMAFQDNWHYELIEDRLQKMLKGEINRLIINIPPGSGKCLEENTIINTPNGNKLLKELRVGDNVYSYKNKKVCIESVIGIEPANKKSVKVKTKTGRELIMSTDHRMLTFDGYKHMHDIKVGERFCSILTEIDSKFEIDDNELKFITNMIFKGDCGGKNLRYSNADDTVIDEFIKASNTLGIEIKQYESNNYCDYNIMGGFSGIGAKILNKYGILGHKCYTKRLPNEFFKMSLRQKYIFIGIMMCTDGYFQRNRGAGITLANEKLIDDIQYLLLTCGIVSQKTYKPNDFAGAWILNIGRSQVKKIYDNCDLKHKKAGAEEVLNKEGYSYSLTYPNSILKGLNGYYARKNGQRIDNKKNITQDRFEKLVKLFPELEKYRYKEFFYDEIISIEEVGYKKLIHIEVTGDKNFIANGLISHNTEIITKSFPVWAMGNNPYIKFIATGYSASLAQGFGAEARDYYKSKTFKAVFPRHEPIRQDQDTKGLWKTDLGGQYLATGTGGGIVGNRTNFFLIDDPIKPDEADSDLKRIGINNWYNNTVLSRLVNPIKDGVIIIMQRTHENDLAGHLMEQETNNGEKWDKIILPAIANEDENFELANGKVVGRKKGDALQKNRYPIEALRILEKGLGAYNFATQYQQNPIDRANQEFYQEWFRYHDGHIRDGRVFTAVDPAFSKKISSDDTSIVTGKFIDDNLFILEITAMKVNPVQMENNIIYHINKWRPEKIGIESIGAQSMIGFNLKRKLAEKGNHTPIEEIRQTGSKETKIRRLVGLYADQKINHPREGSKKLEEQLIKFPNGKHDDVLDSVQMLYELYSLQPNNGTTYSQPIITYDEFGSPIASNFSNNGFFD